MKKKPYKRNDVFKVILIILLVLFGLAAVIIVVMGFYQTHKVESGKNQQIFKEGALPTPLPDGFYNGKVSSRFGKSWQGKIFNRKEQSGINKFADGQRYIFKTYAAQGLRDRGTQVLRIDYDQKGNPWWLHFIVDEIVETSPGHYLGKVHLKIIPGLPLTLTYFELSK